MLTYASIVVTAKNVASIATAVEATISISTLLGTVINA